MAHLTNAGMVLLWIVLEKEPISGYEIDKVLDTRGYRDWARIGKTSVYSGLKRLEQKGFIKSRLCTEKTGRGPVPRLYETTSAGAKTARASIIELLSTTRERDIRFPLALSAIQVLDRDTAVKALRDRSTFLLAEQKRLKEEYTTFRPCLPLGGDALYQHILSSIENEIGLMSTLASWRRSISEPVD